jgi:CheY-like chemotaxis protein
MQKKRKRILVFDDDFESMYDLKEHIEEELQWNVELTADRSLLERLSQERFDLIVVDLMIRPTSLDADGREVRNVHFDGVNWHRTGLEFLRRLRKGEFSEKPGLGTSPDIPVIILSAVASYSVTDELEKDIRLNGYLEKPFRLEELVEKMCRLLQE